MPSLDQTLGGPSGPAQPILRKGTVVASPKPTATLCWVQFAPGEDPADLPYLNPYVPVAGDEVEVLFASAGVSMQGIVLGGRAGQSGNLVVNGNFYRAPQLILPTSNTPPYLWERYVASGTAANVCQIAHGTYQRLMGAVDVAGLISGDTRMVHAGFPVVTGETLSFTAFGEVFASANQTINSDLRVAWMANDRDPYPAASVSETVLFTNPAFTNTISKYYMSGTAVVPGGATHARVVIRVNHVGTTSGASATAYVAEVVATR
jgi:hypothetical protein